MLLATFARCSAVGCIGILVHIHMVHSAARQLFFSAQFGVRDAPCKEHCSFWSGRVGRSAVLPWAAMLT